MSSKKSFLARCKQFVTQLLHAPKVSVENTESVQARLDRLERNYIILLKRVLEIDGVKLVTKTSEFTDKVMATPNDEINKGLNEPEPTIH